MRITMQHAQRLTLGEMREFVASSGRLSFTGAERKQIYGLVERTLRAQLGADHASDPALPPKRSRRARPAPPASLSAPLHTRRYRSVGHRRCGPRRAVGPGAAAHPMARTPRLRPGRLPTIGLPLGLAHLQPATHRGPRHAARRAGEGKRDRLSLLRVLTKAESPR